MGDRPIRVRYAPSPTGRLHVGNLRTGLFAWLFARQHSGAFVLRIEDTDRTRSEARFEESIREDLRWFGLDWDEGPDIGGPYGPYRQSERHGLHLSEANRLLDGGKAYRCFCTEEMLASGAEAARKAGGSWKYPGTCRDLPEPRTRQHLAEGDAFVVRLRVREGGISFHDIVHGETRFSTEVISDPILLRSDQTPTYNYAVVVDDAGMDISHVIRGDDHLSNTPKQVLIYEALGNRVPRFAHLSTVLGPDQTRLSKRHGATSVAEFRDAGYLPEALMNYIALLGWSPGAEGTEIVPRDRLVSEFRLEDVNKSPAVFDFAKLNFINRHYLRQTPSGPELVRDHLRAAGWLPDAEDAAEEWLRVVTDTLIQGVDVAGDIPSRLADVVAFPLESLPRDAFAGDEGAVDLVRRFASELEGCQSLDFEVFRSITGRLKQATGRKGRDLFHPLRLALTARDSGPELDKLVPLVETGARLGIDGVLSCRDRVARFLACHAAPD